ncbi:MAG TPA: hypothetical protein VGL02_12070, partial [Streptomyces sp.]
MLWPVPVADAGAFLGDADQVEGERVVIRDDIPDAGRWIYDLRAATRVHDRDGKQFIGVLPEAEWYRRQRDDTCLAVPRSIPAEQVYIEIPTPVDPGTAPAPADQSDIPYHRTRQLVSNPGEPPIRWARRATEERFVTGARCTILTGEGFKRGYRAVGEPRRGADPKLRFDAGLDEFDKPRPTAMIPLVGEDAWYRWQDTGQLDCDIYEV